MLNQSNDDAAESPDRREPEAAAAHRLSLPLLPTKSGSRGVAHQLTSLYRRWRQPRGDSAGNSNAAAVQDGSAAASRRQPRTGFRLGKLIRQKHSPGAEVQKRVRLRRLRALFRGNDAASSLLAKQTAAAACAGAGGGSRGGGRGVWHGVFTSLSPSDTGGVLGSIVCLLTLAVAIEVCVETCQQGIYHSKYEIFFWVTGQTVSCIILSYGSFLAAIATLALHQWLKAESRKARRAHVKLQRELMKRLREGIRQQSEESNSGEMDEQLALLSEPPKQQQQQQQQSPAGQQKQRKSANPDSLQISAAAGSNFSNDAERQRRELVEMMKELEKLIATELSLMGIQRSDLELLDEALGPKKIGSAWLTGNCRVSLYKAHGHTATAYAHLRRL